jgi:putative transposase
MPRARFTPTTDPYHIAARCINKEWFASPTKDVWEIFNNELFLVQKQFDLKIHSFVLMSNHFHLLASAPNADLSIAMNYFLRESSKQILKANHRLNGTFAGRFFRSRIQGYHHFTTVYKYVYRNPVEAGLCRFVEEYPWSTLNGLLGFSKLILPLQEDTLLFDSGVEQTLKWLNQKPNDENRNSVRLAIRRPIFTLPTRNRKANCLEQQLY